MAPVLTVGSNSWVTLAYANSYFEVNYDAWFTLTTQQRINLLIRAYRWINQQTFFSIPAASTNIAVKQAQCETAWYIYNYYADHEKRRALYNQGVTRFQISKFSETLQGAKFPDFIKDMLEDFLTGVGGKFPIIEREFENNNSA